MVRLEFHLLPRIVVDVCCCTSRSLFSNRWTNNILQHRNVANVIVYGALEICYIFNSASKFTMADGNFLTGQILARTAGACGAISALSGFYLLYQGLCEQVSPIPVPLGAIHCFETKIITKAQIEASL